MELSEKYPQRKVRVYLAGPLFSDAERAFNEILAARLASFTDVYLPQRDGGLMSDMVQEGVHPRIASHRVFQYDVDAINGTDLLIAILDGRAIDEGVAFELGVAFSRSKRCIGLQTDSRRLAPWGNNPMIVGALETAFSSTDALVDWLKNQACDTPSKATFLETPHDCLDVGN